MARLVSKILALFAGTLLCHAQPAASPSPTPAQGALELPVPEGIPVSGIKVPHYDEDGKLLMVLEAAVAKRTNPETIEMEGLKLEALDEEGKKTFIEMPFSTFDLGSKVLRGDQSALIRREDLRVTADSLEFDTNTRFGKLRGNIKMVVATDKAFQ